MNPFNTNLSKIDQLLKTEISLFGSTFNNRKKELFFTELSVLLEAGVTLKNALNLIMEEQQKANDKAMFKEIHDVLIKGVSFSESIKQSGKFSDYEYYSLQIGEETGELSKVAHDLSIFFKRKNEQRKNIISALSYPIVVMITAILAVTFMLKFVVPMFAGLFKQHHAELPALTKFILAVSKFFNEYFMSIVLVLGLIIVLFLVFENRETSRKWRAFLLLKTPIIGKLTQKIYLSQFSQATALLMQSKVPVLNSIKLTQKMLQFYPLQQALKQVEQDLIQGKNLSESLAKHSIFEPRMISLLKVAEETNQNALMFNRLSEQYAEEVQYTSKMLSTVLEPLIIIFLGGLVAVILIAMYLPMFQLSTILG